MKKISGVYKMIKKIFNFIKNNVFLILAAYWFISFAIGFITINPSTLDETTRKFKFLYIGLDLLWSLVFMIEHSIIKAVSSLSKRIDLVHEEVNVIIDAINEAAKSVSEEKKEAETDKKEAN